MTGRVLGVSVALAIGVASLEAQGIQARARVLNAQPGTAAMQATQRILRTWNPVQEPARRIEADVATVTARIEASSAVVSIQFLRN